MYITLPFRWTNVFTYTPKIYVWMVTSHLTFHKLASRDAPEQRTPQA